MACTDGIQLVSRLWSPPGKGPWPALLMRQPYARAIASSVTYAHPAWYAQHGFLVVVQDVRGRGDSGGDFQGFTQEARDGADTISWLRQLPQCNGRVGSYGFSYQGLTQLLNDSSSSEAASLPDCLAPAMAGLDERLHWASEGGAHWWALGLGWGLQLAAQRCQRDSDLEGWQKIRTSLEDGSFLNEGLQLLESYDPSGMALAWLRQDPRKAQGWVRHQPPEALLRKPMLLIGGWHDPHLRGVLDLWERSRRAGGDPQLRIGAWGHLHWPGGADAMQLAFFQHHLQDKALPQNHQEQLAYQASAHGPWGPGPQQEAPIYWELHPENASAQDPDQDWSQYLVHDPWRPVPGRGGHLGLESGPCDRADLDARNDVICFSSAPLEQPFTLLGRPRLELAISADQPGFDLCACLSVLHTNGSVRQLCTGVARFLGEHCLEKRIRQLEFQPLMVQLEPGERLRLSLAASAWPQIALNPGDGTMPMGGTSANHRVISLELGKPSLGVYSLLGEQPGVN
ncbi:CocE/NonD family hydrolase [Cyanobium sp. WAJ14-Wanaka]|nr:CocE/NonD family hydrolase [Cyanobium sp. WAJ14-Wanaka]